MTLGIDFYGTITKYPQAFRELAEAVLQFDEVYIISAVKKGNRQKAEREIKKSLIQSSAVIIIEYSFLKEVPELKYQACVNRNIKLFIDDRKQTTDYLNERGIIGLTF